MKDSSTGGGMVTVRDISGGPPALLPPAASRAEEGRCTPGQESPGGMEERWGSEGRGRERGD